MTLAVGPDDFNLCDGTIKRYEIVYIVYNKDWLIGVGPLGLTRTQSNRSKLIEVDKRNQLKVIGIDAI